MALKLVRRHLTVIMMNKFVGPALVLLFLNLTANAQNITDSNKSSPVWRLGLGVGPNLTKLDVVNDDLGSSYGAALWATRQWDQNKRLDLSIDYFSFSGSGIDYRGLSAGYGFEFFQGTRYKSFALLGLGLGQANNFPRAVNAHQTPLHFFARGGVDEIFKTEKWNIGLIFDFMYVDLDDKPATQAQLGLPMLSISYKFDNTKKSEPTVVAVDGDSDQDGIKDSKDQCPGTPKGSKVNRIGCVPDQKVKKDLRVEFATAQHDVREQFFSIIDDFAKFLNENPELIVTIEGHTDSVGSRSYNIALSQRRADAVRRSLVQRGSIDPRRIKAVGYGPDQPEVSNETIEGRRQNRRVIAVFSSK